MNDVEADREDHSKMLQKIKIRNLLDHKLQADHVYATGDDYGDHKKADSELGVHF